jgi:hypothetical protein
MKHIIIVILMAVLTAGTAWPQNAKVPPPLPANCKKCHACDQPTKANPCLSMCPRKEMSPVRFSAAKGPGIITMGKLSGENRIYKPVKFSHRAHSEMADFSGGCVLCHHDNPIGQIGPCNTCHEENRKRSDISKPDLKGAYHVQCIDCHKSWSHSTDCSQCHSTQNKPTAGSVKQHPVAKAPVTVVKRTAYAQGPVVTFKHGEHSGLYNIECKNCHTNEACVRCHDKSPKRANARLSVEDKHRLCSKCHTTSALCGFCHKDQTLGPFDHARRTGWALGPRHSRLACSACHRQKGKFTGLNHECSNCHKSWTPDSFKHEVTGLKLDEIHASFECSECHTTKDYAGKSCKKCHDDKSWPANKPGHPVGMKTEKRTVK